MVKDISEKAEYTDGTVPDAIDFMAVEMVRLAQKLLASRRARITFLRLCCVMLDMYKPMIT